MLLLFGEVAHDECLAGVPLLRELEQILISGIDQVEISVNE
jgi:hypothetical protein